MRTRLLLLLGLLGAALASGCGEENRALIPEERATALTETVDRIGQACADEDVEEAQAAVDEANHQVSELPSRVDRSLRANLRDWLAHIEENLESDCEPAPEKTATPAETASPTVSPTETPTPEPTETPEPEPTPEVTVEPPGNGGVPAPEDSDG